MPETIEGLRRIDDASVLADAVHPPRHGNMCEAYAFEVVGTVRVHRRSAEESRMGHWWAIGAQTMSDDEYRRQYGMCANWSTEARTDRTLRVGAHICAFRRT